MSRLKMFFLSALDMAGLKHAYISHDVYSGTRRKSTPASEDHRARAIAAAKKLREKRPQPMRECA